jgi:hypothetical protein
MVSRNAENVHMDVDYKRRLIIVSAALAFLPVKSVAETHASFGHAPPPSDIPYMMGIGSFPNPIQDDSVALVRKGDIGKPQKIPSEENLKR